jgi:hypothetical protein
MTEDVMRYVIRYVMTLMNYSAMTYHCKRRIFIKEDKSMSRTKFWRLFWKVQPYTQNLKVFRFGDFVMANQRTRSQSKNRILICMPV